MSPAAAPHSMDIEIRTCHVYRTYVDGMAVTGPINLTSPIEKNTSGLEKLKIKHKIKF